LSPWRAKVSAHLLHVKLRPRIVESIPWAAADLAVNSAKIQRAGPTQPQKPSPFGKGGGDITARKQRAITAGNSRKTANGFNARAIISACHNGMPLWQICVLRAGGERCAGEALDAACSQGNNPGVWYIYLKLAGALGLMGRLDEARAAAAEMVRLKPELSGENSQDLRNAGFPEEAATQQ
jgi:hypothetical protein